GPWATEPARDRRFSDAEHALGQHLFGNHGDCREGLGPDPRQSRAGAGRVAGVATMLRAIGNRDSSAVDRVHIGLHEGSMLPKILILWNITRITVGFVLAKYWVRLNGTVAGARFSAIAGQCRATKWRDMRIYRSSNLDEKEDALRLSASHSPDRRVSPAGAIR